MVEQVTVNHRVPGSSPGRGAIFKYANDVFSKSMRSTTFAGLAQWKSASFTPRMSGVRPSHPAPVWGHSSVGRASALHAECRRFDPVTDYHIGDRDDLCYRR